MLGEERELLDNFLEKMRPLLALPDNSCNLPVYRILHAEAKSALKTIFQSRYRIYQDGPLEIEDLVNFFVATNELKENVFNDLNLEDMFIADIFTDLMFSILKHSVHYQHDVLSDVSRYRDIRQLFLSIRLHLREGNGYVEDRHEEDYHFAGCIAFVIGYILELQNDLVDAGWPSRVYEEKTSIRTYVIVAAVVIFVMCPICIF